MMLSVLTCCNVFCSSAEKFEMFCTPRLDEILKEAYLIESSIIEKKQKLKQELQMIARKIMSSI